MGYTEEEIEQLDYKLSRLKRGKSSKIHGIWCYLDSMGTLHRLHNCGYYMGHIMWSSNYWNNKDAWILGTISRSKKELIQKIESDVNNGKYLEWVCGFGKILAIEEGLL